MARLSARWLLVGGTSLIAALTGHALQLSLESAHLFGGAPAAYAHALQTPLGLLASALAAAVGACAILGVVERLSGDVRAGRFLAALDAVRQIAPGRLIASVIVLQFTILILSELSEQALSSYPGIGLSAIFGAGHWSAPFVYVVVGCLFALALHAFSRAVRDASTAIARFVPVAVARIARPAPINCAPLLRGLVLRSFLPSPPLLARRVASRPPPHAAAFIA